MLGNIARYRTPDGGYHAQPNAPRCTAYACYLAALAYADAGVELPDAPAMLRALDGLRAADGAYANEAGLAAGTTTATAAACIIRAQFGAPVSPALGAWLRARAAPGGGFFATAGAPMPDLLSTATTLFALALLAAPLEGIRGQCRSFVESLWDASGGFRGYPADAIADCEYTFYALLALGSLA